MSTSTKILLIDNDTSSREFLCCMLEHSNCSVHTAATAAEVVEHINVGATLDAVLLDTAVEGGDGLSILDKVRRLRPCVPVIMTSHTTDIRTAVRAMRLGANDFLPKPFSHDEMADALRRCTSLLAVGETCSEVVEFPDNRFFSCASEGMKAIRKRAELVARCDLPVLLLGESGTGKEVLAMFIHRTSLRAAQPFLKLNCAAVPFDLLESEIFGYEAGAFTGATRSKPGKFDLCNHGTILLDEIGEMSPALQVKLLTVLQEGEFYRLGGRTATKVDVRIIAATNVDVKEAIAAKQLRSDLYYRLNGFSFKLPPLRERKDEIPVLLNQFLNRAAARLAQPVPRLSARLLNACLTYPWPGNIRELQYFANRYLILSDEAHAIAELTTGSSPRENACTAPVSTDAGGLKSALQSVRADAEAAIMAGALEKVNWRRKKAAAVLGISYKALLYKMKQHGLHEPGEV